ncbi:MAG: hypothetical protein NUW23_00460 [Firmicutes bacterium]|nr:hypothetical protein [Bacillota bacterium]
MNRMIWRVIGIVSVLLVAALVAGCEADPGLLKQLEGKRVGVAAVLQSPMPVSVDVQSTIVEYVSRRTRLEAVGVERFSQEDYDRLRTEWGLSHLLIVTVFNVQLTEPKPEVSLGRNKFDVKVQYECMATVRFRLVDLSSGEVVAVGESRGRGLETFGVGVHHGGIHTRLGEVDVAKVVEKALQDAIRGTRLF